ncbi:DNA helicase, Rad3 [Desulfitobacterium dichloroeliminans LMG P-21439]|uniref:DNA helicase, Rad3 n=1 Tax=Desulfitobacterium dichloroeliminans (strain LMG P-21439 / DCA1) TaxID=871963 RepID=L0F6M1_DESDL|nr:ATP-dependent DNA helicase [Desulfitobacterium dichloroeliminans]AGA69479.1 DNA helicase, Rad3 [Desulfitobacterium dichloroeliminans LMG P-21439]
MDKKQRVSVRTLVEFVLRQGDLQTGFRSATRLIEGTRAHQILQKQRGEDYQPEVALHTIYHQDELTLEIHGRADGIFRSESGVVVEEIKSTSLELDLIDQSYSILHWAQAQCYAYILASQEELAQIQVQLTYIHLETHETKEFMKIFSCEELENFFTDLVERYCAWANRLSAWVQLRNGSIAQLEFPYPSYRKGQRELVVAVYKTIKEGNRLYVQAPTGIGKTLGTIFPALKALLEGEEAPVFYLTAKTITRTVAESSLLMLEHQGLSLKRLTLTAKDKICFNPGCDCNPEDCSFAKGYYDRLGLGLADIFQVDVWNREQIERCGRLHAICPFEFSLELSNWADLVICDYNYVFDPRVFLKRFFLEGGAYTFLIDEAHNLVDRAQEMFSAELNKEELQHVKNLVQEEEPVLGKRLQTVNRNLLKLKKQGLEVAKDAPTSLYSSLERVVNEVEKIFKKEENSPWKEKLTELYFSIQAFLRTAESFDEHYLTYYQSTEEDYRVKLFCVDPAKRLSEVLNKGRAAIFFSATLSPLEYFIKILGGEKTSYKLHLASPFPPQNLCVMIQKQISTKYKQRSLSLDSVVEAIISLVRGRIGNYLVYFPSYEYLERVRERLMMLHPDLKLLPQTFGMAEENREEFLEAFQADPQESLVALALLGGVFGEGIDLTGTRLSGAIIVSVGLPQLGLERDIIRNYFQECYRQGFEYAYMYPGMNKVLQACGRVIRTEQDRGVILLIDERFARLGYKQLFPKEWKDVHYLQDNGQIQPILERFWRL